MRSLTAPIGYSAYCLDRRLSEAVAFRKRLDLIRLLVDEPGNLNVLQGLQFYALCLEYQPDLIIELGRGFGNSTCVFAEAITQIGHGRLVSFDLDTLWQEQTLPKLKSSELAFLLPVIDARRQDIKAADFNAIVGRARKVLVYWDAHGWDAADGVLCSLLPAIASCSHIVACHDVSDNRYVEVERSYGSRMFWREPELKEVSARYNIGWINTQEAQFLPLTDFLWRNQCALRSADEDLATWRKNHAERQAAVEQAIGHDEFSPGCHWAYFSLNDTEAELTFPAMPVRADRAAGRERLCDAEVAAPPTPDTRPHGPFLVTLMPILQMINRILDRVGGIQIVRSRTLSRLRGLTDD
jgi:hypothetical protein